MQGQTEGMRAEMLMGQANIDAPHLQEGSVHQEEVAAKHVADADGHPSQNSHEEACISRPKQVGDQEACTEESE